MSLILDIMTIVFIGAGLFFFVAGALGLLRFPDVHSRLHALTKADNLGLGCVTLGLIVQTGDPWRAFKLILVWLLAMLAAATAAQLIARSVMDRRRGLPEAEP